MIPTVKLVDENTSQPRIRAIFDDIKATKKIERIPNIWRALAADPEHLELCWHQAKSIMKPGKIRSEAKLSAWRSGLSASFAKLQTSFLPQKRIRPRW